MKRMLVCCLIFLMLFTSTAYAVESNDTNGQELDRVVEKTIVEPRYTYIAYMSIGLDIDENGVIGYSGSARAAYRNMRITVTLQRSTNGIFWDDMEAIVKNGYDNVSAGTTRTVEKSDYFYRAKIVTDVYDSNHNIIETATGYSSEERYQ